MLRDLSLPSLDEPSLWEGAHHAAISGACRKRRSILILRLLVRRADVLDASLDIEDLSATPLHNAELTLSESFKSPRADSVESISINGSLVIIWFFSPPAW